MTPVPRWYRSGTPRDRIHVVIRWLTCPMAALEQLMPPTGRILDWGCGHGSLAIWAATLGSDRVLVGCDVDDRKVAVGNRAAAEGGVADRVTLRSVAFDDDPSGEWDGIVISDVLYLHSERRQEQLVRSAARSLVPGGVLICKEMGRTPAWKWRLVACQEQLSVRVLRITASEGGPHDPPDPDALASWMRSEGLAVAVHPLGRGYHAPHVAVVGRAPRLAPRPRPADGAPSAQPRP